MNNNIKIIKSIFKKNLKNGNKKFTLIINKCLIIIMMGNIFKKILKIQKK